ncbi:MFS general substrate transporter [Melanomma pulvis-pyrius CBS 109.77]|uniref:MFS general substrate transporter n=1 Tax=Melanomma pulvis-pyrius CBS 109.77 TaxID=1314802 RepID=A0A6A6X3G1_9PLEO|nr:MFS general substrate transporter [Melanomma pulvis-pyrius CBS 109.77]
MATYENRAREARDLKDERLETAFEQGHDADVPYNLETYIPPTSDLEKSVHSTPASTRDDDGNLGEETQAAAVHEIDPNIVDWDGPDDPENPMNWPVKKKWRLIFILALVTLVTPLASSFFAPGVPQVMKSFGATSNIIAALVVSIYILGFAIGPLIIAPMSELVGRYHIYNICNLLFVIFTIACAVSSNMNMLIAFRFLAGCVGSSPVTIGGGTIADIFPRDQRAGAMAIWAMGPLLGPVVGPVCGGFLVQAKGWRWVFWILAIFSAFFAMLLLTLTNETYAPAILERKAARLRKSTGNPNLRSRLKSPIPPKELFIMSIVRPMKMLIFSPIVFLMSLYVAINYGILYLLFTTITFVFEDQYHFSSGAVGLAFIGTGVGMLSGMAALGIMSDKIIKKQEAKGNVKPEHRLPLLLTLPGGIALPLGIFLYGWTADKHVHWIAPIIGTAFIGLGNLTGMMTIQTYLVDAFTVHAASAIAANTVLRSMFGAFIPLAGLSLYDKLGLGWGNSLLGFVGLVIIPVPIFFRYYGERIRTDKRFQVRL